MRTSSSPHDGRWREPTRLGIIASVAAAVVVATALVARVATPPPVVPASAPDTVFSAERALRHVRIVAARPHPTGSAANDAVRQYLLDQLRAHGLAPRVQAATIRGPRTGRLVTVHNVVARLPGTGGGGDAVLLVAHYDARPGAPGAGDDASGTATLLETLRALQAGGPLRHDVILLFTDGEEAGLLGAAAFAREDPWARDARVILNFEARGTEGRSFMFETGAGDLDAVRVLRTVGDVSATSLMVLVYRILPNDTDLSMLLPLGTPAMNFAFIDGVERYHTPGDDIAHLDPRSLQHHGLQALALTRAFADGPLPRPRTADAVFFDVPFFGLIVYPAGWAWPISLAAALLATVAVDRAGRATQRWPRSVAAGTAAILVLLLVTVAGALAAATVLTMVHRELDLPGGAAWRAPYAAFVAAVSLGIAWRGLRRSRRHLGERAMQAAAVVTWTLLTVAVTAVARGASYLFVWPLAFAAAALLVDAEADAPLARAAARLASSLVTLVTLVLLVPLVYLFGVALGVQLPGAGAVAMLVALGVVLIAPRSARRAGPAR